jgi:hypothetical protein
MRHWVLALLLVSAGCAGTTATAPTDGAPGADRLPGADAGVDLGPGGDAGGDAALPTDARTDGPVADAAPHDAPPADGPPAGDAAPADAAPHDSGALDAGCTTVSLLQNGDFDQGHAVWTEDSSLGYEIITAAANLPTTLPPQSGGYAAWLGYENDADELLWQTVQVPTGATSLRLRGYRALETLEGTTPWDYVDLQLQDADGAELETLLTYSNADATSSWQAFSATATVPYAGAILRLAVHATTDFSYPTDFFFDSLVLEATVCQ